MKQSDISVALIDHMGSDLQIVNAARVSFNKESEWEFAERDVTDEDKENNPFPEHPIDVILTPVLGYKDAKLINYLARNKHYSPFNHSFITVRVKAPIFVARQLVKHKFMPWNEVSRRYVDEEPEFYFPGVGQWRHKADNVKQGSGEFGAVLTPLYEGQEDLWGDYNNKFDPDMHVSVLTEECVSLYRDLIKSGVCAEQARMVLPQNMMTEWMWSGTLGAFCDMLKLRLDPHTQYESRFVASAIRDLVEPLFPVSVKALLGNS